MDLNSLQKADLLRQLNRMNERVGKLESILQGQEIDGTKIANLTWNKAQGGTAVLGGLNNVDGKLEVRDGLNNEAVILDKNGIQINNGALTIKDQLNTTILDAAGIVSTGAFRSQSVTNLSAGLSFSGTGWQDVAGTTLDTLTFDRDTRVLFTLMGDGQIDNAFTNASNFPYGEIAFHDTVTGDRFTNVTHRSHTVTTVDWDGRYVDSWAYWWHDTIESRTNILTIPAGTHTYHLQARMNSGGTYSLYAWTIAIVVLGR